MEVHSIETIVRALNEAGVQYLIAGGVAVNAHGYERFTKDLDLVIGLEREWPAALNTSHTFPSSKLPMETPTKPASHSNRLNMSLLKYRICTPL